MKKYILMLFVLIFFVFFTFSSLYDAETMKMIINNFSKINVICIILLFLFVALYFVCQGAYMKIILASLNSRISLAKGIFYSFVEFYFSGITPSSTGGQPMQLYCMKKDNIPIRKSYIALMLNTVYFKIIILLFGTIAFIFNYDYIISNSFVYIVFFAIGFIADLALIIFCLMLLFQQELIKKIFVLILKCGSKFRILRKKVKKINIEESLKKYQDEIDYIKEHKTAVFFTFMITMLQRLIMFSISYIVYRGLGYNTYSYFELVSIQVLVQIAIEAFPVPGGTGISENMFRDIFVVVFGAWFANVGMVLTRLFTFYIPLLVSGFAVLYYFVRTKMIIKKK